MSPTNAPFAIVTGVSGRIGFALAERCAAGGFDLLVAAADEGVTAAAERLRDHGVTVEPVRIGLDSLDGVDELHDIARVLGRPVDVLVAGPVRPAGPSFLDQDVDAVTDGFELSVLAPVRLAHRIGRDMRRRGQGRILIAGAAAGPDTSPAMICGGNAFLAGFAMALREGLAGAGVSVTCLIPPPHRGPDLDDGPVRVLAAAEARLGYEAMMRGDAGLTATAAAAIAVAAGCAPDIPTPANQTEPRAFKSS
jgi:short-subunit dehydrogenase